MKARLLIGTALSVAGVIIAFFGVILAAGEWKLWILIVALVAGLSICDVGVQMHKHARRQLAMKSKSAGLSRQIEENMARARAGGAAVNAPAAAAAKVTSANQAYTPPPPKKGAESQVYSFRVAGLNHRIDALRAVARSNINYYYDAQDLLHMDLQNGARIYEYARELPAPLLLPEPENLYDPNAIAVYIGGHHVGYVPAPETGDVAPLLKQEHKTSAILSGGPWKQPTGKTVESGELSYVVNVNIYV